jgi:GT2 family glycosyltransferase
VRLVETIVRQQRLQKPPAARSFDNLMESDMPQMSWPAASVIIPYHNEGELVRNAVRSVCEQTYQGEVEIVVVDSGSTVPAPLNGDWRFPIKLIRNPCRKFAGGARNLGVRNARGQFLCFLDADDRYCPERVASHIQFLQAFPEAIVVGGKLTIHRDKEYVKVPGVVERFYPELSETACLLPEDVRHDCCTEFPFHTGAFTVRRQAFERIGGFDEDFLWGEEWDLQVRLAQTGRFGYLPELTYHYLCRQGSICTTLDPKKYSGAGRMYRMWRKTIPQLPASVRRQLRCQEHGSWLLAAQTFLESEKQPTRAFVCALSAMKTGPSVWAVRSLIRTGLHCAAHGFRR